MRAYLNENWNQICILINGFIVEIIVEDLLLHPDDFDTVTRDCALQPFKKLKEPELSCEEENIRALFEVLVKTPWRVNICTDIDCCGSLCMNSRLVDCNQGKSEIRMYRGWNKFVASKYYRSVCAHALQILLDVLEKTWAYSIALDGSTHQGKAYLDVPMWLKFQENLFNFYITTVILFERQTSENMILVPERTWRPYYSLGGSAVLQCLGMVKEI